MTVTILILVDGFLQLKNIGYLTLLQHVTILILVDGFLQCGKNKIYTLFKSVSQSLF